MVVKMNGRVSAEEFRDHLDTYVAAAKRGRGPFAVTQGSEVVGFFVGREEFETMFGAAVKKLLSSRAKGKTISHDAVRNHISEVIKRRTRKS
jgi:hypothetical protein